VKLGKAQRQHRIAQLLEQHPVTSQAQLVDLLASAGIEGTQATVSRDLEEMGAVKVRVQGGDSVYAVPELPKDRHAPEEHLRRVLGDWVVDVQRSGNIVLVRTPPGSAHVVASALDRAAPVDILGTVAGDDTVIVIATEEDGGPRVQRRLIDLAGLEAPQPGG
jgi:transcriptional regulator of arginine metabolism